MALAPLAYTIFRRFLKLARKLRVIANAGAVTRSELAGTGGRDQLLAAATRGVAHVAGPRAGLLGHRDRRP